MLVNPRISRKDYYHYIMIILDLLVPFGSRNLVCDCISSSSDAFSERSSSGFTEIGS